jgi:hypothetical protein
LAIAVPLAILSVAYALWVISDRLLYVGPLDRAAFGWMTVIPLSWLAPGIAGLAWQRLPAARRRVAALVVWAAVGLVTGAFLAQAIDQVGCAPVVSWTDDLPGSLAVGTVFAAGPALGGLVAAALADRTTGRWRPAAALLIGALVGAAALFAALVAFGSLFFPISSCAPRPL